ncbi:hypothetical protein BDW59DRAFT_146783 [Aspergillus cavernicola]|uniref:Uncharacterized protein n=1 Tax=Aspergillus cavernicola TaxID=176166 RepID=A0ABR4IBI7_9EURO
MTICSPSHPSAHPGSQSNPEHCSLVSSVISSYGEGSVQIKSKLSRYDGASSAPSSSTISVNASCSQQINTFPSPSYASTASLTHSGSSRSQEMSTSRPRSSDRGRTVCWDRRDVLSFGVCAIMYPILYPDDAPNTSRRHCARSSPWALNPVPSSSGFSP